MNGIRNWKTRYFMDSGIGKLHKWNLELENTKMGTQCTYTYTLYSVMFAKQPLHVGQWIMEQSKHGFRLHAHILVTLLYSHFF